MKFFVAQSRVPTQRRHYLRPLVPHPKSSKRGALMKSFAGTPKRSLRGTPVVRPLRCDFCGHSQELLLRLQAFTALNNPHWALQ